MKRDRGLDMAWVAEATMPKLGRWGGGFTLVEVVVSTLIVGGLFVAALTAAGVAKTGRRQLADRARAAVLADKAMSQVLAKSYAQLTVGTHAGSDIGPWPRSDATDLSQTVRIDRVSPNQPDHTSATASGVKRIVVTVKRRREAADGGGKVLARLTALRTDAWLNVPQMYNKEYPR